MPSNVFLTAEWRNLILLNYAVDPTILEPFVPAGVELDSFGGKTWISLVGFQFARVRLLGVPVPFHQLFEEVNLRFYVTCGGKRGVVFIRELVPRRAVAFLARSVYGENYSYASMSHSVTPESVEYTWLWDKTRFSLSAQGSGPPFLPNENSIEQFITEHYWGYAATQRGGCVEYQVHHPQWPVQRASKASFTGDSACLYGPELSAVLRGQPDSAFLVPGSPVAVFKGRKLC